MSRVTMPRARPFTTTRSSISVAREHRHAALRDLLLQRLIRAEQQLLSRLAARVERARHLRAAERAIREQAAVLARERHALRHALVDDVHADLREPVDVRLARAEVAALDRVVEQPVDAVAVVLIVLRRVDAALRRDAVRAPRRILEAEALDVVSELAERRRGRAAGEPRADDDDGVFPLVRRDSPASSRSGACPTSCSSGPDGIFDSKLDRLYRTMPAMTPTRNERESEPHDDRDDERDRAGAADSADGFA